MSAFFSSDGSFSLQFAIIFVVIFLILAGGVFLLRRFTGRGPDASSRAGLRGRQPRLGIVDIYELDRQRQLILLRRDNVEHLLLVGGPNDVVVERNITRGINARLANEEAAYDDGSEPVSVAAPVETAPLNAPLPEAPVQHLAEPFPPRPGPVPGFAATPSPYREPTFEMPVVVPAPVPGSDARPEPARPLDLSAPRDTETDAYRASEAAPAPPKESPIARVFRRTPPPLANLVPAAVAERVRLPERAPEPTPEPTPALPAVAEVSPPAPVVAPSTPRGIDAAILSDMARQLEDALRRPASAVRPALPAQAPAEAAPPPVETHAEPALPDNAEAGPTFEAPRVDEPQAIDPVAAGMAGAAQPAIPHEAESSADDALFIDPIHDEPPPALPETEEPTSSEPVFVDAPEPEAPVVHEVIADAPQVVAAPAPTEPDPPPFVAPHPAPPPPKPAATPNPFSVEEIEAEFARLLGRPLDRKQ